MNFQQTIHKRVHKVVCGYRENSFWYYKILMQMKKNVSKATT